MSEHGIPAPNVLVYVAALAEIFGGLSLLLGFLTRIGALGLTAFLVVTTLVFHDFWAVPGEQARMQMIQFMKNLAVIGGLVVVFATGAGRYSIDALIRRRI
jgi:putative oxidoreductase